MAVRGSRALRGRPRGEGPRPAARSGSGRAVAWADRVGVRARSPDGRVLGGTASSGPASHIVVAPWNVR
ncbi:hypothetical protein C1701_11145 [Actinoalloteichus sp. AHMU CJ021]|nr:hypothetical protein C1701_11145 [Actinoalloteichus sp. AHMU CJ021]